MGTHPVIAAALGEASPLEPFLEKGGFGPGEAIWREGDAADFALFIVSGEAELLKETDFEGSRFVTGVFGPGSVIGQSGVSSDGAVRHITARATTNLEFLKLTRAGFLKFSEENPKSAVALLSEFLKISSQRLSHAYRRMAAIF